MLEPEIVIPALAVYLVIVNIVALVLMFLDKKKAERGAWRIPEKTLFMSVILGGGVGGILGMRFFRHKTKHWYFVVGFPAILIVEIIALVFALIKFVF